MRSKAPSFDPPAADPRGKSPLRLFMMQQLYRNSSNSYHLFTLVVFLNHKIPAPAKVVDKMSTADGKVLGLGFTPTLQRVLQV